MEGQRGMARRDTTCGSYKALEYYMKEVWRQSQAGCSDTGQQASLVKNRHKEFTPANLLP